MKYRMAGRASPAPRCAVSLLRAPVRGAIPVGLYIRVSTIKVSRRAVLDTRCCVVVIIVLLCMFSGTSLDQRCPSRV